MIKKIRRLLKMLELAVINLPFDLFCFLLVI